MPDVSRETGQWISGERRPLAEAVVARQYELQPELRERYGEGGRAKCVQDTEYHLAYLAAAVTYSSPALFSDYVGWARAVLAAFGVGSEDVERNLVCLRDVLAERLPGGMAEAAAPCVEAALRALPEAATDAPSFLDGEDALGELARQYLRALLRGERHEASRLVLDAVRAGVGVSDVYLRVFQPCQQEVGRLWQSRQITVAQEHYCTAATQLAMSQLYPHLFALPRNGRKLAATSVGGELHEVGLRVVADLFEADGWDALYLGANLPAGGVVRAVETHRPSLLLVSATMAFHLPGVEDLIARVRSSEAGRDLKVLVGGRPFNVDTELWRRVGADGHARDAAEAPAVAARLLDLPAPEGRPGRRTYPAVTPAAVPGSPEAGRGATEAAAYDELTRLNNELLTAQRELARRNVQLERLNERLAEADRRKDEFLAMLAHELRNPLAPLRNAAHLLRQPGLDRPAVERAGEMMGRQVQQLGRLVDDLLDLSRIARGKMQLRKERVDLREASRRAADASRPLVEARRHELTVSLPDAPVPLLADPTRLEQVLTNLLNNAARYTPEGGRVWLTAAAEGGEAVVRVRDTGIGIPPEMLPRIFGLFAQAERQEERAGGGLGIGLSLVKSLTELHGGAVEAHSPGPGRGSEFVVRWPLAREEAPTPAAAPAGASAAERVLRVLLVDDSVDAAESLAMLLRLWGHEVAVAHDGPGALRAAEAQRPEVALLDIGLPGMDGYQLARRLRAQQGPGRLSLVALTGWGMEEDRRRSREAGFDHHLLKPVDLAALQGLLAQAQP